MEGLLSRYVMRKLQNYDSEVSKEKGVPRFSWEKYSASVLSITSMAPKKMAEALKVSYGVLRNWRTEPRFKELVKKHSHEFVDIVIDHAKEKQEGRGEKYAKALEKPLEEIPNTTSWPTLEYDEFKDGDLYAPELILEISKVWKNMINKINEKAKNLFSCADLLDEYMLLIELDNILWAMLVTSGMLSDEYIREQREEFKNKKKMFEKIHLDFMIQLLQDKNFGEEHKKQLVYFLSWQKKQIEEELEREAKKKTKNRA